jgi:hypothetical protein
LVCISFEVMEIRELVARVFWTGSCAVCRESTPRANMAYSPELFIISQQYFIVLERFCGEKVTGGSSEVQKFRSSEVEKLKVKDSNSEEIVCLSRQVRRAS